MKVGTSAFSCNPNLWSVTLRKGCSIGVDAFQYAPNVSIDYSNLKFDIEPYEYNGENGVTITGFNGLIGGETVTIPAEIEGKKVLALGRPYTRIPGAENIKKLIIKPATYLKVIENGAFFNCSNLEGTIRSDTVEKVKSCAFYGCTGLTNLDLLALTTVENGAFLGCTGLTSFNTPKLISIGCDAFCDCENITELNLSAVEYIGYDAFYGTLLSKSEIREIYPNYEDSDDYGDY